MLRWSSKTPLIAGRSNVDDLSICSSHPSPSSEHRAPPAAVVQRGRSTAPGLGARRGHRRRGDRGRHTTSSASGDRSCRRSCRRRRGQRWGFTYLF